MFAGVSSLEQNEEIIEMEFVWGKTRREIRRVVVGKWRFASFGGTW